MTDLVTGRTASTGPPPVGRGRSFPVGATVTVHGHRNSNAQRFEIKTERYD